MCKVGNIFQIEIVAHMQKLTFSEIGPLDDSLKHSQKKGFTAKGHGLHWPSHLESVAQGAGSSNESESGSVLVNTATVAQDEPGSSSPSSSGIVADINDSNGESNQVTDVQ